MWNFKDTFETRKQSLAVLFQFAWCTFKSAVQHFSIFAIVSKEIKIQLHYHNCAIPETSYFVLPIKQDGIKQSTA